ncbi:1,4-alpha-glucan branching protein GlgB [Gemmatimonas phototrophica]|uniref:1,4-alpha-glucan branching protein GlgB n=1 Tax=Gemmatimonas phototrophica TaxID=1379270 RepID=UPI0011AE4A32|nr:1,4-alpha-glucan branching protein GlgB [Gemmatimonas phototrophica]
MNPSPLPSAFSEAALRLVRGESMHPHDLLGAHSAEVDGVLGVAIRAFLPRASAVRVLLGEHDVPMQRDPHGLFVAFLSDRSLPLPYRLAVTDTDGTEQVQDDPYRFLPTLGDMDLHLFNEGRHLRLWEKLGGHPCTMDGVEGTAFAVWAPNAARVSVVGGFNAWDGRAHAMRALGASGVFELFIPGVGAEALYKYEILTRTGTVRVKTDPYAFKLEQSPGFASIVQGRSTYSWNDGSWLAQRAESDPLREPMLIYEVHLGSWLRGDDNRVLSYVEIAPKLAEHVRRLGFTHVELLPIQEHPFGGSWGYQVGGYFAPTSRFGTPDDFRFLVDTLHQAGLGVLLDWVPAHFPKDDWALRRFDGTACYEHEDPRLGDHPEWGTHIFNYARHEVRNFLVANALYWIEEFHLDGLRVDAVASMLYLDYGREAGQWLRNRHGGRENLEAMAFLKQLNHAVQSLHPGVITVAEESTSWPKVTAPISDGGLGFTFKWNMGWMHDTLDYYKIDPFFRKGAHDKLTFAMWYEYSEKFMNPISHDEVVHLKKSMLEKMPGDTWQKLANLRTLIGYSITRPGKSLFFMGTELGTHHEWNHDVSLEWHLLSDPRRRGLMEYVAAVGALYREQPCLWRGDHDPSGYRWIDVADREQSVFSYARFDGRDHAVVVLNLTPVPRPHYRLGAPESTRYRVVLNSDVAEFGGSGFPVEAHTDAEAVPYHGFEQSFTVSLPPLSMLVLIPESLPELPVRETAALSVPVIPDQTRKRGGKGKTPKTAKAPKPAKPEKAPKPAKPEKAPKPKKEKPVKDKVPKVTPAKEKVTKARAPKAISVEDKPAKVPMASPAKPMASAPPKVSAKAAPATRPAVKRRASQTQGEASGQAGAAAPLDRADAPSAPAPARPRATRRKSADAPRPETNEA